MVRLAILASFAGSAAAFAPLPLAGRPLQDVCSVSRAPTLSMMLDLPPPPINPPALAAKPFPTAAVFLADVPLSAAEAEEYQAYLLKAQRLKSVFSTALEAIPAATADDSQAPVPEATVMKGFKNFPIPEWDGVSEHKSEYVNPFELRPVNKAK